MTDHDIWKSHEKNVLTERKFPETLRQLPDEGEREEKSEGGGRPALNTTRLLYCNEVTDAEASLA